MLAAGIMTASELAKKCGVSRQTADRWLSLETADVSSPHLMTICSVLNTRSRWLVEKLPPVTRHPPQVAEAAAIMAELSPAKLALWFRWGYRLARRPRQLEFPGA